MLQRFSSFVLLLFITLAAFAQKEQYNFSRLNIANGLSHNQINAIFKDDVGFMWFGTMSGLNRYDGYKFKVFKHSHTDTTSISDDYIINIVQGPNNKMWVLTRNGWSVYDPLTEQFINHPFSFLQSYGIPDDNFSDIVKGKQDNFWFVFPGRGIYRCSTQNRKTSFINSTTDVASLHSNGVSSIAVDSKGDVWIGYSDGIMDKMDGRSFKIIFRTNALEKNVRTKDFDLKLFVDKQDELWIYGFKSARGAFYYKPSNNSIVSLEKDSKTLRLNSNIINGITQDDRGVVWIATDHGGVNLVDKKDFSITYLLSSDGDHKSLSQNSINCIYKDNKGIIWIGTFKKGINHFHQDVLNFPLYSHNPTDINSIAYEDVNAFVEDAAGNLWIGTNGGGLIYFNRVNGTFKQFRHNPSDQNSLSNNVIVSLYLDRTNKLWIGSYFGGLDSYDGKKFSHHKHSDTDPASLADDRVWKIFEDSKGRLWIGTLEQGLDLFDREQNRFVHYKQGAPNSVHSKYISSIIEDKNGNIWIATAFGLDVLDARTGVFRHYEHTEGNKATLSQNNLIDLLEDSRGLIWVGSRDGLNIYDPATKQFKVFRTEDGLPDNTILSLEEDNNHHIWVSTPQGLCDAKVLFSADTRNLSILCTNYDENDGLQGREFNERASLKTKDGELVFGGPGGFNIFRPSNIKVNKNDEKVVVTDLKLFNNSVVIGQKLNGDVVLPQSITRSDRLDLQYDQNVFTLEFTSLNFLNADRIRYAYKLEGFNDEWLMTDGKSNIATFTNLDPGKYIFKVKTLKPGDDEDQPSYNLTINILPPFWKTPVAYFIYFLGICAFLFVARNRVLNRAKAKFALEQERREAKQLQELNQLKLKFLTNISHEFRTPLSLILSPAQKLLSQNGFETGQKKQFQLIYSNARRLLNLVNQLLDFKKLGEDELHLNPEPGDVIQFLKSVSYSFSEMAETKKISLLFHSSQESFYTSFDHNKLERVMLNLLSNAFKFTPEGGSVQVAVDLLSTEDENGRQILQIKVVDTGIGIEKEKQEKIFERFFQAETPTSMINQGSGIGLSITKEFVKLQNGTVSVESEPEKGATFVVLLPLSVIEALENTRVQTTNEKFEEEEVTDMDVSPQTITGDKKSTIKKTLLLVEDSEDFRSYIKESLSTTYNIVEAANGKVGWQRALSAHPDLIVCDISMPEMNGIDLCKKVKGDKRTSHIPVIILTALSGEENQLSGLETGASDYMTKPFSVEILTSKIKNLLQQQESFKKTYQKQVQVNATEVISESADDKFVLSALAVVEKNISNPDFSVEEMSRELFLSRVALYKKLFALTGNTPLEFIRSIRLKRARQLLEKNEMTVAEVAYEVGFNNPKIFSRYFKNEYNILPSVYSEEKLKEAGKISPRE